MTMDTLYDILTATLEILAPVIATLVAILVPALGAAIIRWIQKLGIDIEASHREALQSALMNAALIALRKKGTFDAVKYVQQSVPDAVKAFKLDDARIIDLLQPRITAATLQASNKPGNAEPGA
jgi:hypothetical protein